MINNTINKIKKYIPKNTKYKIFHSFIKRCTRILSTIEINEIPIKISATCLSFKPR